jgi:predicted Holliday junction resolvase-like endonuclease
MIEWIVVIVLLICLFYVCSKYMGLKGRIETRAQQLHERWRQTELQRELSLYIMNWRQKEEKMVRKDAIEKSKSVILGKVTEHLIPFFPDFRYNPQDARFIGTPIDFIVFDGLSEGNVREIVLIEIKAGKSGNLTTRERQIKNCAEDKNVRFELIHHTGISL